MAGGDPETLYRSALDHARAGDMATAEALLGQVLEAVPEHANAANDLGNVLLEQGRLSAARDAYGRALAAAPDHLIALSNMGNVLQEQGRLDDACAHYRRALEQDGDDIAGWINLADALFEGGSIGEAINAARTARRLAPGNFTANHNLGRFLFEAEGPAAAAEVWRMASAIDPAEDLWRFYLATVRDLVGDGKEAATLLAGLDPESAYLVESWAYAKAHRTPETRFFADSHAALRFALDSARADGLVMEFGVRFGRSIRAIAAHADGPVHGFDSFEGLPESWGGNPAGIYTAAGERPEVPVSVELHVGLFEDTLPAFLQDHPGPIRFVNVDCNIYSATRTVLEALAPAIGAGTVIVFDEYLANPDWRDCEHKAFQEAAKANGWDYDYLAFGMVSQQAAVRIR